MWRLKFLKVVGSQEKLHVPVQCARSKKIACGFNSIQACPPLNSEEVVAWGKTSLICVTGGISNWLRLEDGYFC